MEKKLIFKKKRGSKGFTLIEILVAVTLVGILTAVVYVAVDPVTRFAEANNDRRWSDISSISTAVHEYIVDQAGILPTGLSEGMSETQLGTAANGCADCGAVAACLDLSTPLGPYLAEIPFDPLTGSADETRYSVEVDSNGIVWIRSCDEELGVDIYVAR